MTVEIPADGAHAPLQTLSLFSGIGGLDLGLERSGHFETVAFCEIQRSCWPTLSRHWRGVPIYDDVQTLTANRLAADGVVRIDAICGGFPCQDISVANSAGLGLDGAKSGLWRHYARLIGEIRPQFVIVENVPNILTRGLNRVLGDLASLGYDAEWEVISAAAVGAPHNRERLWLVAYPAASGRSKLLRDWSWIGATTPPQWPSTPLDSQSSTVAWVRRVATSIPPFRRDDDGLPGALAQHELGAFGNAVIPQIPELIGRAIGRAQIP